MRTFDDDLLLDAPAAPPARGWFDLSGDVGRGFATARPDAIRLEAILANSGDHDLSATDGPTGYWGTALDAALRGYQKRNGLTVDGWARPDGPTIRHMRDALGNRLDGFEAPTPDDVDAHHAALDAGDDPLIAMSPQTQLGPLPGLPDIGKAGRGSNASQIDWLARNRIGFDGVPEQLARYASELGTEGIAQARDFVAQFAARNPRDADALTAGILMRLPDDSTRAAFLGRSPGAGLPAGVRLPGAKPMLRTMEMRNDAEEAPQPRNLLLRNDEMGGNDAGGRSRIQRLRYRTADRRSAARKARTARAGQGGDRAGYRCVQERCDREGLCRRERAMRGAGQARAARTRRDAELARGRSGKGAERSTAATGHGRRNLQARPECE